MAEDQDPAKKTPPPFHIDSLLGRAPSPNHFSSDGRIDENCSQSLACTTAALPLSVYAQAAPPPSRIQPNAPASTDQGKLKSECCSINLQFPYLTHMRASVKQRVRRLHYMKCAHCKGRTIWVHEAWGCLLACGYSLALLALLRIKSSIWICSILHFCELTKIYIYSSTPSKVPTLQRCPIPPPILTLTSSPTKYGDINFLTKCKVQYQCVHENVKLELYFHQSRWLY